MHSQEACNYGYYDHNADDVKNVHDTLQRGMRDLNGKVYLLWLVKQAGLSKIAHSHLGRWNDVNGRFGPPELSYFADGYAAFLSCFDPKGLDVHSRSSREHFCSAVPPPFAYRIVDNMEDPTVDKDRIKGSAEQIKGSVKETAGKAFGNKPLETEGKTDVAAGKVQNAIGGLKDAVRGR